MKGSEIVVGSTQEQCEFAYPAHYLENLKAPWLMIGDNDVHVYNTFFENYLRDNSELPTRDFLSHYPHHHYKVPESMASRLSVIYTCDELNLQKVSIACNAMHNPHVL